MVAVSAFVVEPGAGVADILTLGIIGAAVALKIAGADKKFCRGKFGQIMQKPLSIEPDSETADHDQLFVADHCAQMIHEAFPCDGRALVVSQPSCVHPYPGVRGRRDLILLMRGLAGCFVCGHICLMGPGGLFFIHGVISPVDSVAARAAFSGVTAGVW